MTDLSIGQVSHLYRPSVGGIENYVHRLNESAREDGHAVTTYTTDLSLDAEGSPLSVHDGVHYCSTTVSPLRNPLSVELHRRVAASDHDIYHLHNPWFLPTLAAAHALPADATTVMTVHSARITNNNRLVRALNAVYRPFARYTFEQVDHSFVQGETEKQRLLDGFDLDPDTVSVVPNGIYPDEYDVPETAVRRFRTEFDLDPERETVLYVSRLIPEKNPAVFAEAVSDHLGDRPIQPVVVGTGEPDSVRAIQRDGITHCSNLTFDQLKAAYHAADLFVFLGTWEGLPTVILEAMNARLPVISTPVGAIPDAITDGEHGRLLSSPPRATDVAGAIETYLDDPARRQAVGQRNRARVRADYHWDGVADQILSKYKELIAETPRDVP